MQIAGPFRHIYQCRESYCETCSTCQIGICFNTEVQDFDRTDDKIDTEETIYFRFVRRDKRMFFTFCKTSIEQTFGGFVTIYPLETSTPLGNCYVHNPCSLSVQASQTLNASGLLKRDHEKKPHFLKMRVNQGRMSEINLHRHAQLHTGF